MPREFSRRARDLQMSVYKAAEYRNLVLFFFPLVIQCIQRNAKERNLWLWLAYMVRSCILPSNEFHNFNTDVVNGCCVNFYKMYEKLFGLKNTTYNTHIVYSHLIEIRAHGPLTLTSAFPFESFYGELRNCFVPRTNSPLKQIMQKILLKRKLSHHVCQKNILYSSHETCL